MRRALDAPLKLIAENTGISGEVILSETKKTEGDWGYDAETGDFTHLLERGIMDPAKVTRAAIENAASVASMVITTESLITDVKEDTPAMPAAPPLTTRPTRPNHSEGPVRGALFRSRRPEPESAKIPPDGPPGRDPLRAGWMLSQIGRHYSPVILAQGDLAQPSFPLHNRHSRAGGNPGLGVPR